MMYTICELHAVFWSLSVQGETAVDINRILSDTYAEDLIMFTTVSPCTLKNQTTARNSQIVYVINECSIFTACLLRISVGTWRVE